MPLVVDVEPVIDRLALEVGDEAGDVNDRHRHPLRAGTFRCARARHYRPRRDAPGLDPLPRGRRRGRVRSCAAATDRGESGQRAGQYAIDLVTDAVALPMLRDDRVPGAVGGERAHRRGRRTGRRDRSRRRLDELQPRRAVVRDGAVPRRRRRSGGRPRRQPGVRRALRRGPWRGGLAWRRFAARRRRRARPRRPAPSSASADRPAATYGWAQFRALGASALDLCLVAAGTLDAFVDMSPDAHGVWDYLAATLICAEAGAVVGDALGRDLVVLDHGARRTPIAAATPDAARRAAPGQERAS